MLLRLLILFVLFALIELALLMWVSRYLSVLGTVALVVVTGIVGVAVARRQGWRTWLRLREELRSGQSPTASLLDGVLILLAGVLLLTPGMLTDAVGFALLIPPLREMLKLRLKDRLMAQSSVRFHSFRSGEARDDDGGGRGTVFDAEFTRKEDRSDPPAIEH